MSPASGMGRSEVETCLVNLYMYVYIYSIVRNLFVTFDFARLNFNVFVEQWNNFIDDLWQLNKKYIWNKINICISVLLVDVPADIFEAYYHTNP